ncbi:holocytochrome c synthase CYC3 [Sporobolomyces koalae]|uniref:holocytochrome c synthase CYC3 n=1 Tax=Sporobolomyces koalae TaxID=500713 RepID=UPI003171B4E0
MGAQQSTPAASATPPPGCPMHEQAPAPKPPAGCPMHESSPPLHAPRGQVNELNNIPDLKQQPAPGQQMYLPLERTISSIPRAPSSSSSASASDAPAPSACPVNHSASGSGSSPAGETQWEYPSPQQFYNALVRKGWETPEESVEMMVSIHNWLNEEAWQQVRRWEERHEGGDRSSLASFQGRPQELSPKARYHLFMGSILPSLYGQVRPFDRHDWVVHRPNPQAGASSYMSKAGSTTPYTTHRYVIDYYHLADDQEGNPQFSLDVRPAVDDLGAVKERIGEWWQVKKDTWFSSSSGSSGSTPGVRVQEN